MVTPVSAGADELAFVQYMAYTNSLDFPDQTLACVCLFWSAEDDHNHTKSLQTAKRKRFLPAVREWLGAEPFRSIQGSVGAISDNYAIQPFIKALHWPPCILYINGFHWDRNTHTEL